jgi:hypothetical protein
MLVSPVPLIPTSYANIVQLTTEQHTRKWCNSYRRLGEPQGFDGIGDQENERIVAADALSATEQLPEAKLPLSFNASNPPYGIFANKRKEAIRNPILKDVYPQFAKKSRICPG